MFSNRCDWVALEGFTGGPTHQDAGRPLPPPGLSRCSMREAYELPAIGWWTLLSSSKAIIQAGEELRGKQISPRPTRVCSSCAV
jgi:hypothetical protein